MLNKFPIYIVSKGRADIGRTWKYFYRAGIPFQIAVEPQEYEEYKKYVPEKHLLKLPFSNLGLGSFPARNFVWEHSLAAGHEYHWVFDDNINGFFKWEAGKRRKLPDDRIWEALHYVEEHTYRKNIDLSGFHYVMFEFHPPKKPFRLNNHIYSGILIKNNQPSRWRLKYNEDVDLCLQVLDRGGTTAACIYYLIHKQSTSSKMRGGNQTELYGGNDPKKKLLKVMMLKKLWPDYVKVCIRFGRPHHKIHWPSVKKMIDQKKYI